jgi:hypothetical protein
MSTLSLHLDELRVESFDLGQGDLTRPKITIEPFTTNEPTMSGCSCVETCPGGAC